MKKVTWYVSTGVGCDYEGEFEVEDNATEEEIEKMAKEEAFNYVDWGYEVKRVGCEIEVIKSIFLDQDKEYLRKRYEKAICKESLEFFLNYLTSEIKVGEIYDFYIVNDEDEIVDNPNLHIDEIVPIFDPEENYLIRGTDKSDKEIEVNLDFTEFWTS